MNQPNNWYQGGDNTVQQVIPLGTGAVSTQTKVVGSVPKNARVAAVRFYGQGAVTATSLTAEVHARTTAGASGASVQASAADIDFGSATAAKAGVSASPASSPDDRLLENQLLEVVITADSCSAGPGDLLVEVGLEPRYDRA